MGLAELLALLPEQSAQQNEVSGLAKLLGMTRGNEGKPPASAANVEDQVAKIYWDMRHEQYGSAPPDQQTGGFLQVPKPPKGLGDRGVLRDQLPPRLPLYDSDTPPDEPVRAPAAAYPIIPDRMDKSLPKDFIWNDAPPPPLSTHDPWDMLRTALIGKMFSRRIPGLY